MLLPLILCAFVLASFSNNYGDIVWWDMLFGTYENPSRFEAACGFDDALEQRLPAMLAYRDVHADPDT
jgi:sterol desaturase/sphingolipid hydroxylase (fatty acid hydroxylase superfamily)